MDKNVVKRVELQGVGKPLEVERMGLDASDLATCCGLDAGGGEEGVQTDIGTDVEETVAWLKVATEEMEHVPVEPF